jgi:DNA-binding NarL/FixJ family response regulator
MPRLKVVIADDHALMTAAVRATLEAAADFEVVGEATSCREALALVERLTPDVLILDLMMPGMDGLACLDLLSERHPRLRVVILSAVDDPARVDAALRRGASAYVLKALDPLDLPSVIRGAVEGTYFSTARGGHAEPGAEYELSKKELEVLRQLALGLSNNDIARALWISEQTVKFHLRNVYKKLGVANRSEAIRAGFGAGLVEHRSSAPEAPGTSQHA